MTGQLSCHLTSNTSITVAVKVLKDDMSSRSMRESFEREVKTISSFDHENILRLIGVVIIGKFIKAKIHYTRLQLLPSSKSVTSP